MGLLSFDADGGGRFQLLYVAYVGQRSVCQVNPPLQLENLYAFSPVALSIVNQLLVYLFLVLLTDALSQKPDLSPSS